LATKDKRAVRTTASKFTLFGFLLLVVVGLIVATVRLPSQSAPARIDAYSVSYPGGLDEIANACGDIYRFTPTRAWYGIIPDSIYNAFQKTNIKLAAGLQHHYMSVPVYGYMDRTLLPKSAVKFYSQTDDPKYASYTILRMMYDYKTTVIWYNTRATDDEVTAIKKYVAQHPNTLALPWHNYNGAPIPLKRHFAFSSWGISQTCTSFDVNVLNKFTAFTSKHVVPRPTPTPQAKLIEEPNGSKHLGGIGPVRPLNP
jgi:hypothetical protein